MADCGADRIDGSGGSFAEQMLELGKYLFDRVQVGRVLWQEEQFGADRTDELANCFAPLAAEIIQDDDIAGSKDRQEKRPSDLAPDVCGLGSVTVMPASWHARISGLLK